jgi:dihydroflavonol-4-reductase
MASSFLSKQISSAFVTGATGLLGNNLVRLLVSRGVRVKALARSRQKAKEQFTGVGVEIVEGDMRNVAGFAENLRGVDVLFHTAAYFRDNFKGGRHKKDLYETNVLGTADLLSHAYSAGIRHIVHTSSIAVLSGAPNRLIDETMRLATADAADYPRSKILSDREVDNFLHRYPDMFACMVLPGWMIGPGDIGPTSSGQLVLNFMQRKLPGIPPAGFSVVDARDVAEAMWTAALKGCRGERYIAAGHPMEMAAIFAQLERLSGVPAPKRITPIPLLYTFAAANELWHFISRKPALISLASVRFMERARKRTDYNHAKSERELGIHFRPVEETLRDTISWYRQNGWCGDAAKNKPQLHAAGESI